MGIGAILLMVFSMVLIWGGLAISSVFLIRRPEVAKWPKGAPAEEAE
ncbi:MAG: methionine/alanine import family NSS transporter small subunit [Propionibacteriaceae bacterium]|jgi:hypothetical protein|nr:methionine/alanine import family NSS transporter small subunit [Propionibacteriaceae bacterium]